MQSDKPTEAAISIPNLTEGQQIGGCFLLKRELFQSRGSRVWVARDEVLGKEVTLHFVPLPVAGDARAVGELRQEVKRNRQLIHPNILRVYDMVEDSGMVAVAMDGFAGESLAELLQKKGAFEPEEIRAWLQQAGETLGDAHRIQLFHRDLSPGNIFIRSTGVALLANFGVSRVISESMERAGHLKGDAVRLSYLSPQQIDGERPTGSDDVYGLGALTYELLAGKPPFTGENVVQAIRKTAPGGINEVRAAAGRAPISNGWERFINSCLAKSADARPKSCGEALANLEGAKGAESPRPAVESPVSKPKPQPEAKAPYLVASPEPAKSTITVLNTQAPASVPPVASSPFPPTSNPTAKSKPVPALSANYPDLDRPKSKLPLVGLGIAASVLAAAIYFKNEPGSNTGVGSAVSRVEDADLIPAAESAASELPLPTIAARGSDSDLIAGAVANAENDSVAPVPEIASTGGADAVEVATPKEGGAKKSEERRSSGANPGKDTPKTSSGATRSSTPARGAAGANPPTPAQPTKAAPAETAAAGAASSEEPKKVATIPVIPVPTAPQPLPKLSIPQGAEPDQLSKLLEERKAAISKFSDAAAAAEKVQSANAQLRDIRQEDLDGQKKALEDKRKTLTPALKAAADFDAEKKRLEESMTKTEAAAKEAARAAEVAKKSYDELVANSAEKMTAKQKAETELSSVTQAVTEGTKQVDELSQAASKAEAQRQQMLDARKQAETEIKTLTTALDKAIKAQREAMVKANRPKITALEQQIKEVDEQLERYQRAVASLQALNDDSTKDATQRIQEKINAANAQKAGYQEEIKRLSGLTPAPASTTPAPEVKPGPTGASAKPAEATPVVETPAATATATSETLPPLPPLPPEPAASAPVVVAKADPVKTLVPAPAPAPAVAPASEAMPKAAPNSLGIKFVTVGDVDFSVHLITRKDFEAFSKATNLKPEHWRNPGFEQTPEHPVVNVTWKEADAFCKWLTDKERKSGALKSAEYYRLPTDTEWSRAVGLPPESGATPEERDMRVEDVYPWGTQWPPPAGAGNFAGEETVTELPIEGYNDRFPNTSPVGSFRANPVGLYDMGGNVWQWVQDSFDGTTPAKTLRGGSWYNGAIKMSLLSSCRIKSRPDTINDTYGFRIVKSSDGKGKR